MEAEDGDAYASKDARVPDVLENMKGSKKSHVGIRASPSKWVVGPSTQLKARLDGS